MTVKSELDVPLRALDPCFEGGVPATLCTCSAGGVPNLSFLSVVHRVDDRHVALSFQYFRKTKKNLEQNPRARLLVIEPSTAIEYGLSIEYERTESEGPTFDRLAASLAAIASQTGMEDRFVLRGADIYRVTACERCDNGVNASLPVPSLDRLSRLSTATAVMASAGDLDELLERTLSELEGLGFPHSFLMAVDEEAGTLFSIASHGYSPSGVGAEIEMGEGLIGTAAKTRLPVRVANMSRVRIFAETVRGQEGEAERRIALPGLDGMESEIVMPIVMRDRLLGVLCLQSRSHAAFGRVDEDLLGVVVHQLASGMVRFAEDGSADQSASTAAEVTASPDALRVRHYAEDDSVFVDNEYLIKGVAGRILYLLLSAHANEGRREFTNRELRLDPRLGLPPLKDNLETRLIMLRRRLADRCPAIVMKRTGRGRFELRVTGELELESGRS